MAVRRCNKRRRANIRRRSEAKHCSSLCSQSEGNEYCGGQTRLKIQQSHALKRWPYSLRVRGPHFASKVSYNAGAATDDYSTPAAVLLFLLREHSPQSFAYGELVTALTALITFPLSPNIPSLCGLKSRGPPCKQSREGLWRIRMQYITCVRGTYVRLPRAGVRGSISQSSQRIRSHGW